MKRIMAAAVAALVIGGGIGVMATSHFTDVPSDHPNRADIGTVAGWGGYSGYPDGTFRPDRRITAEQMATVLGRVFPDGMTRGEFASFMVGGKARMEAATTTTTTTTVPGNNYYAKTYWADIASCASLWQSRIDAHEDWTYSDPGPRPNDPREISDYDTRTRFNLRNSDRVLAVDNWYKRFVTETHFVCEGDAVFTNAVEAAVVIYVRTDLAGREWWSVAYPFGDTLSCQKAASEDWNLSWFNLIYRYAASRDSDGDRIMCEGILPEDARWIVGDPPAGRVAL